VHLERKVHHFNRVGDAGAESAGRGKDQLVHRLRIA
jgi:hypothetical protein